MIQARQEAVTVLRLDTTQHDAAAAKAATAIGQVGKAGEISGRQVAAAMRSLPAQFTDVATQLAGGQNPLLILLQQGGQVRDQFGSLRAAVSGVASLITPATLGVGAVAALGAAFLASERDAARLRNTLALTNNAAGLTPGSLQSIAQQVAANSQASVRGAKEIVLELAASGQVSSRAMDGVATAVARVADVSGKAAADVAKDFAGMSSGVAAWALQHNRSYNFLTADVYRQIVALEQQQRTEEAMLLVSRRITDQLEGQREQLGYAERAWTSLGNAASWAWQQVANIGADRGAAGRVDDARERLGRAERVAGTPILEWIIGSVAEAEAEFEAAREVARLEQRQIEQRAFNVIRDRRETQEEVDRQRELERKRQEAARAAATARERAFDRTPPLPGLDYRDRSDRLLPPPTPDTLGEFLVERVLPDAQRRQDQRLKQEQDFLQQLVDANAAAGVQLIADDRQRALAQLVLEREQQQRRIELVYEAGTQRAEAERLADEAFAARAQASGIKFAKDTALVSREETRDALANAFRDAQGRPLQAFGKALGNVVFQRVTTSLADAVVGLTLGPVGGGGGLFGSLLGTVGSFFGFGGARASGGPAYRGRMYEINEERGPGEVFNTRSGRSFLLAAEDGDITPQPRRGGARPAMAAAGGPSFSFNYYGDTHIGSNVSRAEIAQQLALERRASQARIVDTLRRERAL